MSQEKRRLAAIMFTDVVGYSSITSRDEEKALKFLDDHRKVLQPVFSSHGGFVVKTIGDGFLVEFESAVEAVKCAVDAQREMAAFNRERAMVDRANIRIGIHVGDVVATGTDILGDAVNVAARIEPIAEPGGICVTRQVADQVQRKVGYRLVSLGARELKNIGYPVEVLKVEMPEVGFRGEALTLDTKRIAVLPFANMSPDPNDAYFADGLTEELISTVSKINELQVISRTSVMRYKSAAAQVSQIGQELSVGSVLEGSVRKAGNKLRITAQLIEVDGDKHVWSQSYDRDFTDVFTIQADIAEKVAESLKVQLLQRERANIRKESTSSPEAYGLYLKGRFYWNERTEASTRKALKYFEEAVRVDPGFALAYSGLADAYSILTDYGWMGPAEALPLARMNATKALQVDSSLAEAHASMGLFMSNFTWDLTGAEKELKLAIQLKPNYAPAYHWYAVDLFYMRRHLESGGAVQHALTLDPYSRVLNMVNANQLVLQGRYSEALRAFEDMIASNPDFSALRYWRSICYLLSGEGEKALEDAKSYIQAEGSWTSTYSSHLHLAWIYASTGQVMKAEEILREAMLKAESGQVSSANIGWVHLELGRKDDGYSWMERAFAEHDPALLYFNGFPWTKKHRSDPRWASIESKFPFKSAPD